MGLVAVSSPALSQNGSWNAKQDGHFIATGSNAGNPVEMYPSRARATVNVRLDWSMRSGQPVETYRFRWEAAEPVKLLRPFANRLPAEGDITGYREQRAGLAGLKSTELALQIQFTLRAPKRAVKRDTFFTDCDSSYCYAKGVRDIDTGDVSMGSMARWHGGDSPKSPTGGMLATWLAGCMPQLECQANTLRAGTDIRIDRVIVSKLRYDVDQAQRIVQDWAAAAQDRSTELAEFREELARLTGRRYGREDDPEIRAGADLIHYSGMLNEMTPLRGKAQFLDWQASETGRRGSENRYYREWEKGLRALEALHREAKLALNRARLGNGGDYASVTDLARLEQLQVDFAKQELELTRVEESNASATRSGRQALLASKRVALRRAKGSLSDKGQAIDDLTRSLGNFDPELSYARRATDVGDALTNDIRALERSLAQGELSTDRTPALSPSPSQGQGRATRRTTPVEENSDGG